MRTSAESWNKKYPEGTDVFLVADCGDVVITRTRSEAWALGDGTPVVKVCGWAGGYSLDRLTPMAAAQDLRK